MPGTGGTPISTFYSTTPGTVPTAGQLVNGELFINIADGKIFYKNSGGVVKLFGAGLAWLGVQTANFSPVAQSGYPVNTTSTAITALLPATPSAGDAISFLDYAGTFQTHALTIDPNGGKINGVAATVVVNTPRAAVDLVYVDSTQGWVAYAGFASSPIASYSVNYLVVAGGGGGGQGLNSTDNGGGGGAGGVQPGTATLIPGTPYTITVGLGGAFNSSGSNSSISGVVTSIGGGNGATAFAVTPLAGSGGSGGGGCGARPTPGSGTGGQGYAGGSGNTSFSGGGGGASAVGANATAGGVGGNGGAGISSSISGTASNYGGGGGGCGSTLGTGGIGGGGSSTGATGVAGTANTGGGGGGGGAAPGSNWLGGAGGSGIVIIAYLGVQRGTGGTVTSGGGYTIHTFTSSGTYNA